MNETEGFLSTLQAVTSRWLSGEHEKPGETPSPDEAERFAHEDLEDLMAADIVVAFTESPGPVTGRGRGGRHVELGYALARGKRLCVVGHRENVFCHLPEVEHYEDFPAFLQMVERSARRMRGAGYPPGRSIE